MDMLYQFDTACPVILAAYRIKEGPRRHQFTQSDTDTHAQLHIRLQLAPCTVSL